MKIIFVSLALFFGIIFNPPASHCTEPKDSKDSARLMVHLLDYLAKDYAGAVSANGEILSQTEFAEQVEFVGKVFETGKEIDLPHNLVDELARLKLLIGQKEKPEVVIDLARTIQMQVIKTVALEVYPTRWPNIEIGKKLYAQNCTACHGATGAGDGLAGKGLDPAPANFKDTLGTASMTPFGAFNTIRLGVPGTGMTSFPEFSDSELWAISFYVNALKFSDLKMAASFYQVTQDQNTLKQVASLSDNKLKETLGGSEQEKQAALIALRTYSATSSYTEYSWFAKLLLKKVEADYTAGDFKIARTDAIRAYLEGIEPLEARIRANDNSALVRIEEKMALVRSNIENQVSIAKVNDSIKSAIQEIESIELLIEQKEISPFVAFTSAFVILLREGFEAVLIIFALLGVIRASESKTAAMWVHGGWLSGVGIGFVAWFSTTWLMKLSGVGREMLEGLTSIFAVVVLLYIGFWMHRQTEVTRWNYFLKVKVKGYIQDKNLWGLAVISFVAVFREAIETVLFLKAIWLDSGESAKTTMTLGVFSAFIVLFLLSWLALNWSKSLPIKKLFTASSILMMALATILIGKGIHSIQETGLISSTSFGFNLRFDLIGLYPTAESLLAQLATFFVAFALWTLGSKKDQIKETRAAVSENI